MRHSSGILRRSEDLELAIGRPVGFHAFVGLLPVVEARGQAMDAEERVGNKFWARPFSGLDAVVGFDMAID